MKENGNGKKQGAELRGGLRELTAALRGSRVIALTGGGGKTTLLYFLAGFFAGKAGPAGQEPAADIPGCIDPAADRAGGKLPHPDSCMAARKVLLTTTTKIRVPAHQPYRTDAAGCREDWSAGHYAAAGIPWTDGKSAESGKAAERGKTALNGKTAESGIAGCENGNGGFPEDSEKTEKLSSFSEQELLNILSEADVTFIEADGAKRLPLKLPAEHEPVIPAVCDTVIAVAGLSALGKPAEETCFRWERYPQIPGLFGDGIENAVSPHSVFGMNVLHGAAGADPLCSASGVRHALENDNQAEETVPETIRHHMISERDIAMLLASGCGGRKGVGTRKFLVCLNQCDTEELRRSGEEILRILWEEHGIRGFLTAFTEEERERYC